MPCGRSLSLNLLFTLSCKAVKIEAKKPPKYMHFLKKTAIVEE